MDKTGSTPEQDAAAWASSSASTQRRKDDERMLEWFKYDHLNPLLREASKPWAELAHHVCATISQGPERTVALRKLLEGKDAAVRATLKPGG